MPANSRLSANLLHQMLLETLGRCHIPNDVKNKWNEVQWDKQFRFLSRAIERTLKIKDEFSLQHFLSVSFYFSCYEDAESVISQAVCLNGGGKSYGYFSRTWSRKEMLPKNQIKNAKQYVWDGRQITLLQTVLNSLNRHTSSRITGNITYTPMTAFSVSNNLV